MFERSCFIKSIDFGFVYLWYSVYGLGMVVLVGKELEVFFYCVIVYVLIGIISIFLCVFLFV